MFPQSYHDVRHLLEAENVKLSQVVPAALISESPKHGHFHKMKSIINKKDLRRL